MLNQAGRDGAALDDRVTPVVQRDELGQQFRAKAVPVAADAVDLQRLVHHATATLAGCEFVRQRRR
jgi:hypothetical protein